MNLASAPGKYDLGIGLFRIPVYDFVISKGILNTPSSPNLGDILAGNIPSEPNSIGNLFTRQGSSYDFPDCREYQTPDGLVILNGSCVFSKANFIQTICDGKVDFTDKGNVSMFDITGFTDPWEMGNWSIGDTATFRCKLPTGGNALPSKVLISGFGLVNPVHQQHMLVSINGGPSKEALFTNVGELITLTMDLPQQNSGSLL
jgi:hypothetical protein